MMVLLLLLRMIICLKIRTIPAFILMKNPASVQRSSRNGADKQERQNSFEALHREIVFQI
jgi:hypothetical protein